jgi:hypothetical protein
MGGVQYVAADNRLTAEQIAALLEPGDTVTIESAADLARPRHALGTVVRVAGPHIVVTARAPAGDQSSA